MNFSSNFMGSLNILFDVILNYKPNSPSKCTRQMTHEERLYESVFLVISFEVKPIGRKFSSNRKGLLLDSSFPRQQQQQLDAIFTSRHLN